MALKDKINQFVEKNGYSAKAFMLSTVVFPPAALFILIKHPSWSITQRAIALVAFAGVLAVVPIVVTAVLALLRAV